jgi:hypothetical protein
VAGVDLSDGHDLVLRPRPPESLGAASGNVRVPLTSITAVEVDARSSNGLRAPGTAAAEVRAALARIRSPA